MSEKDCWLCEWGDYSSGCDACRKCRSKSEFIPKQSKRKPLPHRLQNPNSIKQHIIKNLLEDMLDREVLINIDLLFDEQGNSITKRKYGEILVKRLVEDLSVEYLDEPIILFEKED